jgi:DNA polymerase I-like protein with 3'-5' exonuclease and polymerase domains
MTTPPEIPKIPQTMTLTPPISPTECALCVDIAWKGPLCANCPAKEQFHYAEGMGADDNAAFFCIAESPHVSNVSSKFDQHQSWQNDLEKTVRDFFTAQKKLNNLMYALAGRFTYAVRCQIEKPSAKEMKCCASQFIPELVNKSNPTTPIMIFALGPTVVKSLGIRFRRYASVQGQFISATVGDRKALVYPSFSKRQLATKTGYIEVLKSHIKAFLEGVIDVREGRDIQLRPPLEELIKNYVFPNNLAEVVKLIDTILNYNDVGGSPENNPIAIDTETNTKFPHRKKLKLLSIGAAWAKGRATSILMEHPEAPWTLEEIRPHIARLLQSPQPKVFQNGQFDIKVLAKKGFQVRKYAWDTLAGEHLLAEDKRGFYGLKILTKTMAPQYAGYEEQVQDIVNKEEALSLSKQLKLEEATTNVKKLKGAAKKLAGDTETDGFAKVPVRDLLVYGAIDTDVTRIISGIQRDRMNIETKSYRLAQERIRKSPSFIEHGTPRTDHEKPLAHLLIHHVVPTMKILASMEAYGFAVDREYIDSLAVQMSNSMSLSKVKLLTMIAPNTLSPGQEFNPNSPAQLQKVLFGNGYLHPDTGKAISYAGRVTPVLTKKGKPSTNAAFLRSLVTQQDCVFSRELLQYRAMTKARNTFVENIRILSAEDGRMHTSFHITGTGTGRLCVSARTLLNTDQGPYRISTLDLNKTPNIKIITHKGRLRKINKVIYKGLEEMYHVELENGAWIETTQNHRFFTPEGFKHLKNLKIRDDIATSDGISISIDIVKRIKPIGIQEVWDIEVDEDHSYVAQGFVNHNSSSDENMQNTPLIIGKHNIKKIFIPSDPEIQVLCNTDAKAAEVRVYAAYSRDANLVQALNDGLDTHSYFSSVGYKPETVLLGVPSEFRRTTLELIGIDEEHAWSYEDFERIDTFIGSPEVPGIDPAYGKRLEKLRKNMKRVVFGVLYGAGRRKVAEIVGISLEQAQTMIDILFRMFPTIPKYIEMTKEQIRQFGIIETFFGRRRRLDLSNLTRQMQAAAFRKGVNFNIQSTSSDIVLSVLCDIDQPLRDLNGRMLITVHDSLVFEIPKKYITQLPDLIEEYGVKRVARRYPWLPVPFKWDIKVGPSYGETMNISKYLEDYKTIPTLSSTDQEEYIEHEIRSEFEQLAR